MKVFLLNSPDSFTRINDMGGEQFCRSFGVSGAETTFISKHFFIKEGIEKLGLKAYTTADILTSEDYEQIDHFVERIALGWYKDGDEDILLYRGVSLGSLGETDLWAYNLMPVCRTIILLHKIGSLFEPTAVFLDDKTPQVEVITSLMRNHSENTKYVFLPPSASEVPKPIRSVLLKKGNPLKALAYNILNWAFLLKRVGKRRKRILFFHYGSFNNIYSKFLSNQRRLDFLLDRRGLPASKRMLLRLMSSGSYIISAPTDQNKKDFMACQQKWESVKPKTSYRRTFTYGGIDFFQVFEQILGQKVRGFGALSNEVDHYYAQLRKARVDMIAVPFDVPQHPRLLVSIGKELGIPTIVVQHGFKDYLMDRDMMTSDLCAVWSQAAKENYALPRKKSDRIFVIGNPLFDSYVHNKQPVDVKGNIKRVCIVTHSHDYMRAFSESCHSEIYLKTALAEALKKGLFVTVKFNPAENLDYYRIVFPDLFNLQIGTSQFEPIGEVLAGHDLVIVANSTVAAEALVSGKPVVCLNVTKRSFTPPLDGNSGVRVAHNSEELELILTDYLKGAKTEFHSERLEYFFGTGKGDSSDRTLNLLSTLINGDRAECD